jgi:hypothetical protein
MVPPKDRLLISAIKPVAELGQLVAGDIIGEPRVEVSRLEDCFMNVATTFCNEEIYCNHPYPKAKL